MNVPKRSKPAAAFSARCRCSDPAPFLLVNGDVWTDIDFGALRRDPPGNRWRISCWSGIRRSMRAAISCSRTGWVAEGEGLRHTYSGIGIYRPEFFAGCAPGKFPLLPLLRRAIAARALSGELHTGRWYDVGTDRAPAGARCRAGAAQEFRRETYVKKIVILVVVLVLLLGGGAVGHRQARREARQRRPRSARQEAPYLQHRRAQVDFGLVPIGTGSHVRVVRSLDARHEPGDRARGHQEGGRSRRRGAEATRQLEASPPEEPVDAAARRDDAGSFR